MQDLARKCGKSLEKNKQVTCDLNIDKLGARLSFFSIPLIRVDIFFFHQSNWCWIEIYVHWYSVITVIFWVDDMFFSILWFSTYFFGVLGETTEKLKISQRYFFGAYFWCKFFGAILMLSSWWEILDTLFGFVGY